MTTTAPQNLLAVRRLLLDNLPLDPLSVGIVGDPAHRGGYHCGDDRVVTSDYSVVESPRDKAGLSVYASALDVGLFSVTVGGKVHNLRTFSVWCVSECINRRPGTENIREIIYSSDGQNVRRWDRLGLRSSGDDSHLIHTHFSFFRDSTKGGWDLRPLFVRYLTAIGLLEAPVTEIEMRKLLNLLTDPKEPYAKRLLGQQAGLPCVPWVAGSISQGGALWETYNNVKALRRDVAAGDAADLARDNDLRALLEKVNSGGMTPDEFVTALAARLALPPAAA